MGIIQKFALIFLTSAIALYLSSIFVDGVSIPLRLEGFAIVAAALTLIHLFIRPLIKVALTPITILTLGLGSVLVNVLTLYLLDLILPTVAISGFLPLIFTTFIVSIVNLVVAAAAKII